MCAESSLTPFYSLNYIGQIIVVCWVKKYMMVFHFLFAEED